MTMQNIRLILNAGIEFNQEETQIIVDMMLTSLSKMKKAGESDEDIKKCARDIGEWRANHIINAIFQNEQ